MKLKEVEMYRALMETLEAIYGEILKADFYSKAAEDNLERLQGRLVRAQRADTDRLDHAIQQSRELVKTMRSLLDAAIRLALEQRQPR